MDIAQCDRTTTEVAAVTSEAYRRLVDVGMAPSVAFATLLSAGDPEEQPLPLATVLTQATVWAALVETAVRHQRRRTPRPHAVASVRGIEPDPRVLERAAAIALTGGYPRRLPEPLGREVARLLVEAGADRDRVARQAAELAPARRRLDEWLASRDRRG